MELGSSTFYMQWWPKLLFIVVAYSSWQTNMQHPTNIRWRDEFDLAPTQGLSPSVTGGRTLVASGNIFSVFYHSFSLKSFNILFYVPV